MDLFVCIFSQTDDVFDLASTVGLDLFAWRKFVFMLVLMDYQFHLRMTSIHWSSGSKLHAFIYVLRISLGKLHSLEVDSFAVPFSCNNMVTSPITWCCPCARWPISSYHLNRPWKTCWRYGAIAVSCIIVDTVLSIVHRAVSSVSRCARSSSRAESGRAASRALGRELRPLSTSLGVALEALVAV